MTWRNRFKLFFGFIAVVAIVGVLTIMFSQRKGEAESTSASIEAITYPVGTDYAGTVVEQFVLVGDEIVAGDPIATVQSNTLAQDLADGATIADNDVFTVSPDGTLTIKSTVNGVVASMDVQQGSYAASGSTIATLAATDGLYVEAQYILDPKDFGRVLQGAEVELELPNSDVISGTVGKVEVTTEEGQAISIVRVESEALEYGSHEGLVASGTPVIATMQLRNDDVLARLVDTVTSAISDVLARIIR
jgi:multidrug resistance efflux pump